MARKDHLNEKTRAILVDWLIDVSAECHLDIVTLSCAVGLVDRCLSVCEYKKRVPLSSPTKKRSRDDIYDDSSRSSCESEASFDGELVIGGNTLQLLGW